MKKAATRIVVLSGILLLMATVSLKAQNQEGVFLDSLQIITRNLQDLNELLPRAPGDSAYSEQNVEVTIQFVIRNVAQLRRIEIYFEKELEQNDFKFFKLDFDIIDGKPGLAGKDRFYPIINSRVIITEQVPVTVLQRKIYFSLRGVDKAQKSSNILVREFN